MTRKVTVVISLFILSLTGCTAIHEKDWTRIDGARCQTIKVNPVWYSSETSTFCLQKNREAKLITTNHDDISILAGFAGVMGILFPIVL